MQYSDKVMDHFLNPRNVGQIEDASGVGEVGNAKCGDIMKIFLDIEDEIKKMKEIKKDILEIIPKLQNEADDESAISIQEKSFEEIFREFYKKERNVEADEEVVSLLLKLINEEGDENETN